MHIWRSTIMIWGVVHYPMWLQISAIIMKVIWITTMIMHNMVVDDEERDVEFNSIF
jgi:hypothetical protein